MDLEDQHEIVNNLMIGVDYYRSRIKNPENQLTMINLDIEDKANYIIEALNIEDKQNKNILKNDPFFFLINACKSKIDKIQKKMVNLSEIYEKLSEDYDSLKGDWKKNVDDGEMKSPTVNKLDSNLVVLIYR